MRTINPTRLNLTSTILDKKVKTLYITAPSRDMGTSTMAISLAEALATNVSEKILLIDGNYHANRISTHFDLQEEWGYVNVDSKDNIEHVGSWIDHPYPYHFDVLAYGKLDQDTSQVKDREILQNMLDKLLLDYDYILFDAPPIHESAKGLALASAFDGVVLVIAGEDTRWEVARAAQRKLSQAGATLIGAIFNKRKYYVPQWVYNWL